jgi:hypothetical protein
MKNKRVITNSSPLQPFFILLIQTQKPCEFSKSYNSVHYCKIKSRSSTKRRMLMSA